MEGEHVRSWQYKLWEPWNCSSHKKAQMLVYGKTKAKVVVDSKTGKSINGRWRMQWFINRSKTQEGKDNCKEAARRRMLA